MVLFCNFVSEMSDIIHLLPDSVANQIAAGEVVQRPASAVKELLENSIDSGANDIKLIIRESGKELIQVTDNGCGMSERDARMCFERHATSKIKKSDDLLNIRTLGFRGEALASIASVAQVELRTKRLEDEVGTQIIVEGSDFKGQSPFTCQNGTTVLVRNLFFNVPARRNFLKSNALELKHIVEEFFRVALVYPDVAFTLYNHDKIQYQIPKGSVRQRITSLFGNSYSQRLIPVEQNTDLVNIAGFIGKPEFARKTRGEQYFFTNGRFMRSPYLNNAIERAFKELIPDDSNPIYFIYLEVPPGTIDVNIHPTKTEINFQDNKSIYAILHSAVKQSIGKFNLSPTLDFEAETALNIPPIPANYQPAQPKITVDPSYNPFEKKVNTQPSFHFPGPTSEKISKWQDFFSQKEIRTSEDLSEMPPAETDQPAISLDTVAPSEKITGIQIQKSFIVTNTKSGIVVIDQQNAHERILYERFSSGKETYELASQALMFPQTVNLTPDNASLYSEWKDHFTELGFEINDFGNGSFVIHAFPFHVQITDAVALFENVLEGLRNLGSEARSNHRQALARTLARRLAIKRGRQLQPEEVNSIIENLFACNIPDVAPDGKPTMVLISFDELYRKLKIYI
jgi:DNA mismatch repair protein MutL